MITIGKGEWQKMIMMCKNCGYFDPEDQKCYYFVDQYIYLDGKPAEPMYAQPDDFACEVWTPTEEEA